MSKHTNKTDTVQATASSRADEGQDPLEAQHDSWKGVIADPGRIASSFRYRPPVSQSPHASTSAIVKFTWSGFQSFTFDRLHQAVALKSFEWAIDQHASDPRGNKRIAQVCANALNAIFFAKRPGERSNKAAKCEPAALDAFKSSCKLLGVRFSDAKMSDATTLICIES